MKNCPSLVSAKFSSPRWLFLAVASAASLWVLSTATCRADGNKPPASGELIDITGTADTLGVNPNAGATIKVVDQHGSKAVEVTCPTSDGFPGVDFPVPPGGWDLSGFTGVQVDLTNTSQVSVGVAMRVDNDGDWTTNPWSSDSIQLDPGETKTLKIVFGQSFGQPAFKLDPAHVTAIKIFVAKPTQAVTFQLSNLKVY
jgi:hypothetical protein